MKNTKFCTNQITIDPRHAGYSDLRLWPCYMVFSGLVLLLAPHIGMFASIMLVGIPAFIIAIKVAGRKPDENYVNYKWSNVIDRTPRQKNPIPFLSPTSESS